MEVSLKASFNFFLFLIIFAIVILLYTRCCGDTGVINLGIITDPKGATIVTPPDQQLAHVTIDCASTPVQNGGLMQYKYRINVKDLGIVTEQGTLLPVFIFKGSAIAAEFVTKDGHDVPSEQGLDIPDPNFPNPLDATYSFKSFETTSIAQFSSVENIVIVFVNADKDIRDLSESGLTCKTEANPNIKGTDNIESFTKACQRLIKGVTSVRALNKCIVSGLAASIENEKAEDISGTTRISFDIFSLSGITKDNKVKIKISCNTDDSKNKFVTQDYIEQVPGQRQRYQADVTCNMQKKITVYKDCSAEPVPTCSSNLLAQKLIA